MQAKQELMLAEAAWELARRELDEAIGIELDEGPDAAALQAVNVPRFRRAVIEERSTRQRTAAQRCWYIRWYWCRAAPAKPSIHAGCKA